MRYGYPAIFSEAADGVTVTFPYVPEAVTWGATPSEAKERAADALISAQSIYVEENRPNPKPSPARPGHGVRHSLETTNLAPHDAMLAAGVSNRELASRLRLDENAVRAGMRLEETLGGSSLVSWCLLPRGPILETQH